MVTDQRPEDEHAPSPSPLERLRASYHRSADDHVAAGVAGGIAASIGIPAPYVRAAFVVLAFAGGFGLALYLIAWGLAGEAVDRPPAEPLVERKRLALVLIFVGALLALRAVDLWTRDDIVWPIALVAFGVAAVWDRREGTPGTTAQDVFFNQSRGRMIIGGILMLVGLSAFFSAVDALASLGAVMVAVTVTTLGFMFLFGPWVWRMAADLAAERRDRIRTAERAEVAAHLHDSVLQTLALIQRTDDPKRMVTIARAQERELRNWLYGTDNGEERFGRALEVMAARVEESHDVPVEVVSVGDLAVDDDVKALVAAAGEAMTNAAKHSGATRISVYAEVAPDTVDVWVSDQGSGFDPAAVDADRRGIVESIRGRMARHRGNVEIVSDHGEGTEVHLSLPSPADNGKDGEPIAT